MSSLNFLDQCWDNYNEFKDSAVIKSFVKEYENLTRRERVALLNGSAYFSSAANNVRDCVLDFFSTSDSAPKPLLSGLSRTKIRLITLLLMDELNIKQLKLSQFDSDTSSFNKNSGVVDLGVLKILDSTSEDKLSFIEGRSTAHSLGCQYEACGSLFFDASFIHLSGELGKIVLVSISSPIDGILFLTEGVLVTADSFEWDLRDRLLKYIQHSLLNWDQIDRYWTRGKNIKPRFLVKDKRPYHVVADELVGYFALSKRRDQQDEVEAVTFHVRSSFFETERLPFSASVASTTDLNNSGTENLYYSNIVRLTDSALSPQFENWISSVAVRAYRAELDGVKGLNSSTVFWIAITGGEKRYWIEEFEGIVALVNQLKEDFSNPYFIFDGYTATSLLDEIAEETIEKHSRMLSMICDETGLVQADYTSLIGAKALRKIAYANVSEFCMSSGTPAMWCSKIAKVKGIYHGNHAMLGKPYRDVCDASSMTKVSAEDVTEISFFSEREACKRRWDFVNYSIKPKVILNLYSNMLKGDVIVY